jgi:hypothetical protein
MADGVRDFAFFFRADSVLGFEVGAVGVGTASAFDGDSGEDGWRDRCEGRSGFESGGWALSDSVMASAAARSAARAASWGVDGAAGGAWEGAVGFAGLEGSGRCQLHPILSGRMRQIIRSAQNLVVVEKRKCCRHATALGAPNVLNSGVRACNRGIGVDQN